MLIPSCLPQFGPQRTMPLGPAPPRMKHSLDTALGLLRGLTAGSLSEPAARPVTVLER